MKMLILGASGGCGRWLVQMAAAHGHDVTALVRPSTPFEAPPGVTVRRDEVINPKALDSEVAGVDIVMSCLGLRRAGASPWAKLLSPPDLMTRITPVLIASMNRQGVRRIMVISAGGVGESAKQLSRPVRWFVQAGNIGVAYRDLSSMESALAESGLDWLAVRPVTLVHGKPMNRARPVEHYGLFSTVRRADVAAWMLATAEEGIPLGQRAVLLGS